MNLAHIVATRLLRGTQGTAVAVSTVIGRRRRTRTYHTPTQDALREEYAELVEAAPSEVRRLVGPYLLRGDIGPEVIPKPAAIDWEALARDAETVVKLFDLYIEYIEEEDDLSVLLLSDL